MNRPAPYPLDESLRVLPTFVEWMQGFDEGWINGLKRTEALKALGNSVVPQQALMGLRLLDRQRLAA